MRDDTSPSQPELSRRAAGVLRIAVDRMLRKYPFHAHLVATGRFIEDATVTTMAVTAREGALTFLFNATFVLQCLSAELVGVLLHEIGHVLFGHLLTDPADFPDQRARVIAEEVTVNEFISEPLPGQPILLSMFPKLPENEDTEARYRRLRDQKQAGRDEIRPGKDQNSTGSAGNGTHKRGASSDDSKDRAQPGHGSGRDVPQTLDDHSVWTELQGSQAEAKRIIETAVQGAAAALTPEEAAQFAKLPASIRERVEILGCGNRPGTEVEALTGTAQGTMDWRRQLRRYVRRAVALEPTLHRPSRRFPELAGVVPGRRREPDRARVMAVIDSSGSMDGPALELISAEIEVMSRHHDVFVVECDTEIQASYRYKGRIEEVLGRGGTDFRPPLTAQFLRAIRPDLVVFFTDGEGPAPDDAPIVPVLWCLTADGTKPAPWGHEVRMP